MGFVKALMVEDDSHLYQEIWTEYGNKWFDSGCTEKGSFPVEGKGLGEDSSHVIMQNAGRCS